MTMITKKLNRIAYDCFMAFLNPSTTLLKLGKKCNTLKKRSTRNNRKIIKIDNPE